MVALVVRVSVQDVEFSKAGNPQIKGSNPKFADGTEAWLLRPGFLHLETSKISAGLS